MLGILLKRLRIRSRIGHILEQCLHHVRAKLLLRFRLVRMNKTRRMRQRFIAVDNAALERGTQTLFLAGLVGQLHADLANLRQEFNLPDVSRAADAELAAEFEQWGKK